MKSKNQKMLSFSIYLSVLASILGIIGLAGYRIYSERINTENKKIASEERKVIKKTSQSILEQSKPKIKISKVTFGLNDIVDSLYHNFKHQFAFSVTNYGKRPAYELFLNCVFLEKLSDKEIGRHKVSMYDSEYRLQSSLMSGETRVFKYPFTISKTEGIEQLKSTLVKFEFSFLDKQTGEKCSYSLYERFIVSSKGIELQLLKKNDIELIDNFLSTIKH